MLKQKFLNLILVIGMGLVLGLIPAMATAGGIITHGRLTSESGLEQEDDEQSEDDDGLTDSQIQNQLYLFVSMITNGHESFASVGTDDDDNSLEASPDDDTEAGGCQQFPVSSLSTLLGFAWLMRLRRRR